MRSLPERRPPLDCGSRTPRENRGCLSESLARHILDNGFTALLLTEVFWSCYSNQPIAGSADISSALRRKLSKSFGLSNSALRAPLRTSRAPQRGCPRRGPRPSAVPALALALQSTAWLSYASGCCKRRRRPWDRSLRCLRRYAE